LIVLSYTILHSTVGYGNKHQGVHTKQGRVTGTLLKLAHGCRAISHDAYQTSAMPKP